MTVLDQKALNFEPMALKRAWAESRIDIIFAGLAISSLLPLFLVRYPQSVDYLNHLARLFILTSSADQPIHNYYVLNWHLLPNLGIEPLAVVLAPIMSLEAIMKLIWAMIVLGTASGAWFVHRSLHNQTQPSLLLAALVLINLPLSAGLLNYALGVPVALIAIGVWLRGGERPGLRTLLLFNCLAGMALILHFAAAAALGFTVAVLHLFRGWRPDMRQLPSLMAGFILPAFLFVLMILQMSASSGVNGLDDIAYDLFAKAELLVAPVYSGHPIIDVLGVVGLWGGIFFALRIAGGTCHSKIVMLLPAWLIMLLILPNEMGRTAVIDTRLALFPVLLLISALSTPSLKRVHWQIFSTAIIACVAARIFLLIPEWRDHEAHIESFRALESKVDEGAKVLVVSAPESADGNCSSPKEWLPFDAHLPALLTIDRGAFVSLIFADSGMQPILPAEKVSGIVTPDAGMVTWPIVVYGDSAAGQKELSKARRKTGWKVYYPPNWRKNFDVLAVLQMNCAREIPPEKDLVPIGKSETYQLYRIVHG